MATPEEAAAIDRLVNDAVAVMYPGDMVGRYLLVAEVIDAERGERAAVCITADDAMPWDTMGLAEFALARERAGVAQAERYGDED